MTTIHHRHQIIESLRSLDKVQTEKVLEYIRTLANHRDEVRRQVIKSRAMAEIRQALGN